MMLERPSRKQQGESTQHDEFDLGVPLHLHLYITPLCIIHRFHCG